MGSLAVEILLLETGLLMGLLLPGPLWFVLSPCDVYNVQEQDNRSGQTSYNTSFHCGIQLGIPV